MIQFIKRILDKNNKEKKDKEENEMWSKKWKEDMEKEAAFIVSKKDYRWNDFVTLLKMDYEGLPPEEKVEQKYKAMAFHKKITEVRICPVCGEDLKCREWVPCGSTYYCSSSKCDFSTPGRQNDKIYRRTGK